MPRLFTPQAATKLASLAAVVALSACSDTTAPRAVSPDSPSFTVGTTADIGPIQVNLVSSASTQYCGSSTTLNATFADGACVNAFNLQTALATYNPGWDANIGSSAWIGSQANANEYTVLPGTYKFNTTFNVPAGATSPILNLQTLSDNLVAVYLNGHSLGGQAISDCVSGTCNWQLPTFKTYDNVAADFNIGGSNTLTIYLTDTPIGLGKTFDHTGTIATVAPLYNCASDGPQQFGKAGFSGGFVVPTPQYLQYFNAQGQVLANPTWLPSICLNPAALDYVGTVSYVPAPPPALQWCSPGFWKNHLNAWSTADQNKLYSTLSGAAPLSKKAPAGGHPTLLQVISDPSTYGGPATNSVADYLSGQAFGSSVGTSADDSRCNNGVPL